MTPNQKPSTAATENSIPAFLTPAFWQRVVRTLVLTPQQARIVGLILQGKQDKEIASAMGISPHTVRSHLRLLLNREAMEDRGSWYCACSNLYADGRHDQPAGESAAACLAANE